MSDNYEDIVRQAYSSIGRTGVGSGISEIDPGGLEYWKGQLESGALNPTNFSSAFNNAVQQYVTENPEAEYTKYVQGARSSFADAGGSPEYSTTFTPQPTVQPPTGALSGVGASTTQPDTTKLTDYRGNVYDASVLTGLASNILSNTDLSNVSGGVYGTSGESVGFDAGEVSKVLGRDPKSYEQVAFDMARYMMDMGITDLSQLTEKERRGELNVTPNRDEFGNILGYSAFMPGVYDTEGGLTTGPSRALTQEEISQIQEISIPDGEGGYTVRYVIPDAVHGYSLVTSDGRELFASTLDPTISSVIGSTYTGPGGTQYTLNYDPATNQYKFGTYGTSSSDLEDISNILAVAQFVPGLAPFAMAANAAIAASQGNVLGALAGAAGIPGLGVAGDVVTALNVANAIKNSNPLALAGALANTDVGRSVLGTEIAGGITLGDTLNTARMIDAVNRGDMGTAVMAAATLSGSSDAKTAAAAFNVISAMKTGDPLAMAAAMGNLASTVNATTRPQAGTKTAEAEESGIFIAAKNAGATDEEAYNLVQQIASAGGQISQETESIVRSIEQPGSTLAFAGPGLPAGVGAPNQPAAVTNELLQRLMARPDAATAVAKSPAIRSALGEYTNTYGYGAFGGDVVYQSMLREAISKASPAAQTELKQELSRLESKNPTLTKTQFDVGAGPGRGFVNPSVVTAEPKTAVQTATKPEVANIAALEQLTKTGIVGDPYYSDAEPATAQAYNLANQLNISLKDAEDLLRTYPSIFGDSSFEPADPNTMRSTDIRAMEAGDTSGQVIDNLILSGSGPAATPGGETRAEDAAQPKTSPETTVSPAAVTGPPAVLPTEFIQPTQGTSGAQGQPEIRPSLEPGVKPSIGTELKPQPSDKPEGETGVKPGTKPSDKTEEKPSDKPPTKTQDGGTPVKPGEKSPEPIMNPLTGLPFIDPPTGGVIIPRQDGGGDVIDPDNGNVLRVLTEAEVVSITGAAPVVPEAPDVEPPVTKKTDEGKPSTSQPSSGGGMLSAMLPAAMIAGAPQRAQDDESRAPMLQAKETQKAIDPLAKVKAAQEELEREVMMQNLDPRLAAILAQRMQEEQGQTMNPLAMQTEQPTAFPFEQEQRDNSYYSYGSEQSIDDILRGATEQTYKDGGYVQPLMATGGMALPLLAKSGGALPHRDGREDFKDGKHVAGEGDGQSDDIPAWLADGEFVFPADVVSALGNGSTKAGTDKLYEMMHGIRERARSKGPKDLPPPALKSPLDYLKSSKRSAQ